MVLSAALTLAPLAGPAHAGTRAGRYRAKMLSFVNDFRAHAGLGSLRDDRKVDDLAWNHSLHMARDRRLFHTTDLTQKLRYLDPSAWGENVGVGTSIWRVFKAFRDSAPHRANMLNSRYHAAGVGVVRAHGGYWITMIFYG